MEVFKCVWMWSGDMGSGEHRDAGLIVGFDDLRGLFFNDPMIL